MAEKNCFDMTKLILQIMCVTVVQWSGSFLHVQINRVLLPATLISVSWYRFFPVSSIFFNTIFPFRPFFLYSFCRPCCMLLVMHLDKYIFYFKLKSGVLFWKKGFQKLLICILAKLTTG